MIEVAPARALPVHAPMTQFPSQGGELLVGGQRLSLLAARVGQTPFYAYDRDALRKRVADLRKALPSAIKLHYAMKANPMPAVVGFMAGLVDGIDVAQAPQRALARMGVLSDARGLYPRLTAREHIRYYGELQGVSGEALTERTDQLLQLLDMGGIADRRAGG